MINSLAGRVWIRTDRTAFLRRLKRFFVAMSAMMYMFLFYAAPSGHGGNGAADES